MMIDNDTFIIVQCLEEKSSIIFEIRDLKKSIANLLTSILENGKVHIERCAIMSDRFCPRNQWCIKKYNL